MISTTYGARKKGVTHLTPHKKKNCRVSICNYGGPGAIRTHDLPLRRTSPLPQPAGIIGELKKPFGTKPTLFTPVFTNPPIRLPIGGIMKYLDTLQAVDPKRALKALGMESTPQGAYLHFACKCEKTAVIKAYGQKKNLWYCKHCKTGGHIISLTMARKETDWEGAKLFLKDFMATTRRTLTPLDFRYDLQYSDILEKKGIKKEFCDLLGIGKPKGKTMLAGCIAFEIREEGKLYAYYGIRIKDGKAVFHKSFNPELYLYGEINSFEGEEVLLTRDMFECARLITENIPVICNFGLPYLSQFQIELLKKYKMITFKKDDSEIPKQLAETQGYFRIV